MKMYLQRNQKECLVVRLEVVSGCKHMHITNNTRTSGTPYIKGYCPECKSFVYTEKNFCICCRKRVVHKNHYIWLKRVLNKALAENSELLDSYKLNTIKNVPCIKVQFRDQEYLITINALITYSVNGYNSQTIDKLQDSVIQVRRTKKGRKVI